MDRTRTPQRPTTRRAPVNHAPWMFLLIFGALLVAFTWANNHDSMPAAPHTQYVYLDQPAPAPIVVAAPTAAPKCTPGLVHGQHVTICPSGITGTPTKAKPPKMPNLHIPSLRPPRVHILRHL